MAAANKSILGKILPKKQKNTRSLLTAMETKFVAHYAGNGTKAAKQAGYKHPKEAAARLLAKPRVKQALEHKQAAMITASGKLLAKTITVTRNDIINRLDQLSQSAESDSAKISALGHLIDIFGLSANKRNDTDFFAGWSDEQLEYYREHGVVPPSRGGPAVGKSHGDTRAAQPPAAKTD
jgi:hypothetical protein